MFSHSAFVEVSGAKSQHLEVFILFLDPFLNHWRAAKLAVSETGEGQNSTVHYPVSWSVSFTQALHGFFQNIKAKGLEKRQADTMSGGFVKDLHSAEEQMSFHFISAVKQMGKKRRKDWASGACVILVILSSGISQASILYKEGNLL